MLEQISKLKDFLSSSPNTSGLMQSLSNQPATSSTELQEVEATLGLAYFIAGSDGEIDDSEYEALKALLSAAMNPPPTDEELNATLDRFDQALETKGFDKCMEESAAVLDAEGRRAAMELAVSLGFANGELTEEEESDLFAVGEKLGLSETEVDALINNVMEQFAAEEGEDVAAVG